MGRSAPAIRFFATRHHEWTMHSQVNKIFSKILERDALPASVHQLGQVPEALHLVGELPPSMGVAVIGTRHPTDEAVAFTHKLVSELAEQGVTIWSGGARGIDAAAHRAALRAGVPTVVVAPAGWLRPYPPEHAALFCEIVARGGAYLSIVDDECCARRHQFFARNALLVALVQVVIVVQAGWRSGARNAAKFARELGRLLFVAPSSPWIPQGLGCNLELGLGARILGSASEVVRAAKSGISSSDEQQVGPEIGSICLPRHEPRMQHRNAEVARSGVRMERGSANANTADGHLEPELRMLLEAVRAGATHVDELCERTGMTLPVVQSVLLRLTLLGLIRTDRTGVVSTVNY